MHTSARASTVYIYIAFILYIILNLLHLLLFALETPSLNKTKKTAASNIKYSSHQNDAISTEARRHQCVQSSA